MTELVTTGYLTLDDIVLEDGRVLRDVLGGGALYSAAGARVWNSSVGIHGCSGADYPEVYRDRLVAAGIDLAGVTPGPERSLRLWLLEEGGQRKQQLPKLASAAIEEMDAAREPLPGPYDGVRGVHVATSLPETQLAAVRAIRQTQPGAIVTLDIWTESFFPIETYRDPAFLSGVDAFLPSDKEVEALWGLDDLPGILRELASRGPGIVAVKRGASGALVFDRNSGALWTIPACDASVVDTIGAGDAWCGGFLAGLTATGEALEAGLWGAVSASFAIGGYGAASCLEAAPAEATRRRELLRRHVRRENA
jgi:cytidine kinase